MNSLFSSTTIPVLEQVAQFAQMRHQVLAGNIANVDTPGYKTRDMSVAGFESRMRRAIEVRDRTGPHALPSDANDPVLEVKDDLVDLLHHDRSNVSLEHQIAEIAKNQIQHNLAMTIMGSQFKLLQAAISERA